MGCGSLVRAECRNPESTAYLRGQDTQPSGFSMVSPTGVTTLLDTNSIVPVSVPIPDNVGFREAERVVGFMNAERGPRKNSGNAVPNNIRVSVNGSFERTAEQQQVFDTFSERRAKKKKSAKKTKTNADKFLSSVPDLAFDIQYRFKIFVVGDRDTAKPIIMAACSSQECPVPYASEMSEPDPSPSPSKARSTRSNSFNAFTSSLSMMSASSMSQSSLESRFGSEFSIDDQEALAKRFSEGSNSPDGKRSPCPSEHRLSEEEIAKRLSEGSNSPPASCRSPCLSETNARYISSPCATPGFNSNSFHSENLAVPVLAPSASSKSPVQNRCICSVPYPLQPPTPPKFAKLIFNALSFNSAVPRCRSAQDASSTAMVFCITVDPAPSAPSLDAQLRALLEVLQERRRKKRKYRPAWAVLLCHRHSGSPSVSVCISPPPTDELEPWSLEIDEFEREHGALWKFGPTTCQNGGELYSVFAKIASQRIHASEHPEAASNPSPEQSESGESENSADASKPTWGAEYDELTSSQSFSSYGGSGV